jgi:hypothetical protein
MKELAAPERTGSEFFANLTLHNGRVKRYGRAIAQSRNLAMLDTA